MIMYELPTDSEFNLVHTEPQSDGWCCSLRESTARIRDANS
jgi:hypothetical protein